MTDEEIAQQVFEWLDNNSGLTTIQDSRTNKSRYLDEFPKWREFGDLQNVGFEGGLDLLELVRLIRRYTNEVHHLVPADLIVGQKRTPEQ